MATVDQQPAELHVTIFKGDAWRLAVDFDMDLSGYTIVATIHPKDGSADVTLAIDTTNLAAGQFSIVLTAAQAALLAAGYHPWCVVLTPAFTPPAVAQPRTYFAGRFIVKACK